MLDGRFEKRLIFRGDEKGTVAGRPILRAGGLPYAKKFGILNVWRGL